MALTAFPILGKPRNGCHEERTALIQPIVKRPPGVIDG
jgi:hypothetical protein